MVVSPSSYRKSGRVVALASVAALAACQSGTGLGGLLDRTKAAPVDVAAAQAKVDAAELRAYCPTVRIRSGDAVLDRFEKGAEGDKTKQVYQASITETTRACSYGEGTLTMNIAVAGRVVPGPLGAGQSIAVPIKIEVIQGESDVLHSRVYQQQVQVQPDGAAAQFVFTDPGVTFPMPAVRNIRVFVGFDVPPKPRETL